MREKHLRTIWSVKGRSQDITPGVAFLLLILVQWLLQFGFDRLQTASRKRATANLYISKRMTLVRLSLNTKWLQLCPFPRLNASVIYREQKLKGPSSIVPKWTMPSWAKGIMDCFSSVEQTLSRTRGTGGGGRCSQRSYANKLSHPYWTNRAKHWNKQQQKFNP